MVQYTTTPGYTYIESNNKISNNSTIRFTTHPPRPKQIYSYEATEISPMDLLTDLEDMDSQDGSCPRKRKRLTHLSPEERMLRRKLKNRVAAQSARDRKKERMVELEAAVLQLEEDNNKLQTENFSLVQINSNLFEENKALRERLGLPENENLHDKPCIKSTTTSNSGTNLSQELKFESAAFLAAPLQKELALFLLQIVILQLFMKNWKKLTLLILHNQYCNFLLEYQKIFYAPMMYSQNVLSLPMRKWWGAHQQNWNPAKIQPSVTTCIINQSQIMSKMRPLLL